MADDKPKSYITKQFSGLPMKALIGAPLKAAADANGMLARSQTQFILSTCFDTDKENNDRLVPKMISFNIERTVIDADGNIAPKTATMGFSIPLLTLIPINTLAVDELDIAFEMEVKSSSEYNHETSTDAEQAAHGQMTSPYQADKFSCEMHGTLTNANAESSTGTRGGNARYEIKLHAGKSPLPLGLTTIIDAFTKNIAPIQLKKGDKAPE